ncbi:helix-turn-helix domain-containing protein [Pseudonocardia nematodicida]|uniref:Helix-turn-helix domain-containing protein n=1 Tax=Pseudonocardia nematodicida TaxID=1206997 RepID=A0ABV1KIC1_9PSEU
MEYRRYEPASSVSGLVEHYWSVRSPAPPAPVRAVLVPNGRATMQFCLGVPGRRLAPGAGARRNADVYLPVGVEPLVIEQEDASHYVGIQFTPWGARALFPAATESPAQIEEVAGPLPDSTALAADPARELDRWLVPFLPARSGVAPLLAAVTERIDSDPSGIDVGDLPGVYACSASTLYRAFRHGVGLTPKQYIQVMRHRGFTDRLLSGSGGEPMALLAALSGYADQSHASHDFTRFTGMTVTAFRDTYDGVARLMAQR